MKGPWKIILVLEKRFQFSVRTLVVRMTPAPKQLKWHKLQVNFAKLSAQFEWSIIYTCKFRKAKCAIKYLNNVLYTTLRHRPHVSNVFSGRIRKFLKTLSRVEIFWSHTNTYTCGRSYPEIFEYVFVILLDPVFMANIINKHGIQQGCSLFVSCSDF